MPDEEPKIKEFLQMERESYDEQVGLNTANTLQGLDEIRPTLTMYPRAYEYTRDAYREMPYVRDGGEATKPNPKFDAFYARRLADIMYSFALRINAVKFSDETEDTIRLQNVDLSHANDVPDTPERATDEAIRQSFMDDSGTTDRDVARHGDRADQSAIDAAHAESRATDRAIRSEAAQQVAEIVAELGGKARIADISDDDAQQVEGDGGAGDVQLGTLYESGSSLGGEQCGVNCARLLFKAVLEGTPARLGLSDRLQILTEYGVMTKAEIQMLVEKIQDQVDEF